MLPCIYKSNILILWTNHHIISINILESLSIVIIVNMEDMMRKIANVLGVINSILSIFVMIVMVQYLIEINQTTDGWAELGLFLMALLFLLATLILTIPFVVFLIKLKYQKVKFYVITHVVYSSLSVILFVLSIVI